MKITDKRYLGSLCFRGHNYEGTDKSLKQKLNRTCCECQNLKGKKYRQKNKGKAHQYMIKYYEENKGKSKALSSRYYIENRAWILEQKAKYREENKEKIKKKQREWYDNNPEKTKKSAKEMSDGYIKGIICHNNQLNLCDVPQELVETKRISLKLKRLLRKGGEKWQLEN